MQELLRWLATWKGIPLAADSELHVEFVGFPSGGRGLLVILGIVLVLGIVALAYRRDGQRLPRSRRILLASLRALAVLFACALLLEPNLIAIRRDSQPGHTIVLLDRSQSMGHRDAYRAPETTALAAAWRSLGANDLAGTPRIELAKRLFSGERAGLWREIARHNKTLVYAFAEGLEPLGVLDPADPADAASRKADPGLDALRDAVARLAADGSYSNIESAVRGALERSRESNIAGVVLVSDGRRNLGGQGPEIARLLRSRKIPHTIVLPIGDPTATRTLRLARVDAPEKVFQKDPFTVRVSVEAQGYDDVTVPIRLQRQSATGETVETLRTEQVRIGATRPEAWVEFTDLRAEAPGLFHYAIEIEPPELEAQAPERHTQRVQVEVLGEQTRVLLIAGGPTHEYRVLRRFLERDKTIEVACWLQSAGTDFSQDGDVHIDALPEDRAALEKYDVFVLLDPDSTKLDAAFCENVAAAITEDGAGMWWVCGEKHTLDALRETASTRPLADLLPVAIDFQEADDSIGLARGMARAYRFALTPAGEEHKATRLVDDRAGTSALWPRLPGVWFAFPVLRAKPAAQVLVTHRKPTTRDPSGEKPALATHFVGAGRVLFSASDDTHRWLAVFSTAYERYWVKGLRYLYEGRLNAGNSRLRITIGESRVELGNTVRVTVDARAEDHEPLVAPDFALVMRRENGQEQRVVLSPVEAAPGQYQTFLRPDRTGYYWLSPAEATTGRPVQESFQVVPAAIESEGPADVAELGAVAAIDGGRLLGSPSDFADAVRAIPSATRIETYRNAQAAWDSWVTVAILLGLLAAEWWLRKRSNLL